LPYAAAEATHPIEVTEAVPIPWWVLAVIGGVIGIALIGGVIYVDMQRKKPS
jgi:hypothetical protein